MSEYPPIVFQRLRSDTLIVTAAIHLFTILAANPVQLFSWFSIYLVEILGGCKENNNGAKETNTNFNNNVMEINLYMYKV